MVADNNTIDAFTGTANSINYKMIEHDGTTGTIKNNTIKNCYFDDGGGGYIGFNGIIIINDGSATTVDSNTIINMTSEGDADHAGIVNASGGTMTCNGNIIGNIALNNPGIGTQFFGIWCQPVGDISATGNIIFNIFNSGESPVNFSNIGIVCEGVGAGNIVNDNVIRDMYTLSGNAVEMWSIGIITTTGGGFMERNGIFNLSNSSTNTASQIVGILIDGSSGDWDVLNNFISLDNGGATNDIEIIGIFENAGAFQTTDVYHNTVTIGGDAGIGGRDSWAFLRGDEGTDNVTNNLFQNLRINGVANHFAFGDFTAFAGALNNDYNDLEVLNDSSFTAFDGGVNRGINAWKTVSTAPNSMQDTTNLSPLGYAPIGWIGQDAGFDLFTPTIVTDDKDGKPRDINPWIGCYEGPKPPCGTGIYISITSGNFSDSLTWDRGCVPGPNDTVYIVNDVNLDIDIRIATLGDYQVVGGGNLFGPFDILIDTGRFIVNGGLVVDTLINHGDLTINGQATVGFSVINGDSGSITNNGDLLITVDLINAGNITTNDSLYVGGILSNDTVGNILNNLFIQADSYRISTTNSLIYACKRV